MSISFVCPCGRRYEVDDTLAGKLARCRQCGTKVRIPIPAPAEPELELEPNAGPDRYSLDNAGPPRSVAARGWDTGRATITRDERTSSSKSPDLSQRIADMLPRNDDMVYPTLGGAGLLGAVVLAAVGGFYARAYVVFLTLAGPIFCLAALVVGLATAYRRGIGQILLVLWMFLAAIPAFILLAAPMPSPPVATVFVLAGLAGLGVLILLENRCDLFRRAAALGSLGSLLMVSLAIMLHAVRPPEPLDNVNRTPQAGGLAAPTEPPSSPPVSPPARLPLLPEARRGFKTVIVKRAAGHREPVAEPPPSVFRKVAYESPVGRLPAYLTPDPGDGVKHPAIVWITGGDCNTIDDVWTPADPKNDQTAAAYRKAGIVMMFPSLRGGNDNPGIKEGFLGEVDDVLAAADHLAKQSYVDPSRIYLGGHSTGGTLVLLVAESTERFRAVFSFGPVHDVRGYGLDSEFVPFDSSNPKEVELRAPQLWLHSVGCPTYVFEGTDQPGNIAALRILLRASTNSLIHFYPVQSADHFRILAPTNQLIAEKILRDDGRATTIQFTTEELNQPFAR